MTAVLGLVGAATVSAQVYSVNVVGYVNTPVCPGYNLIANPLDNKAGNNVENLFPTPPTGLQIFVFRNGAMADNYYDPDFGGWTVPGMTLAPGEGFWLNWPGAKATLTFVGDVMQGKLTNPVPAGYSIRASMVPQAGKLVTDLGFPVANGDLVYLYNLDTNCAGGYADSTYDPDFGGWSNGEPSLAVGQGFWIVKTTPVDWVRDFTVK
jgi:hypothetical protein